MVEDPGVTHEPTEPHGHEARIDPELRTGLALLTSAPGTAQTPPVGDVATRRTNSRLRLELVLPLQPAIPNVQIQHYSLATADGARLPLRWYQPIRARQPGSAVLYIHGGGLIFGMHELGAAYDWSLRRYVADSGVPMLLVDYRIAPEFPYPVPVDDCFAALVWLVEHANDWGVDPTRVAVMGDSAGGGLAAAVCLMARDRQGPEIAMQMLIYPMLDDRTTQPDPWLVPVATWTYQDNITGWQAYLGEHAGAENISAYAAAARATDLSRLPPTYLEVGDLDIFRDENLDYARRLAASGVATELHVHPGCPHAFEGLVPDAAVSRRAIADRVRRLRGL